MGNPVFKKNPWMSLWLSGANAMMSAGGSLYRRQQQEFLRDASEIGARLWMDMLMPGAAPARRAPAPVLAGRRRRARR